MKLKKASNNSSATNYMHTGEVAPESDLLCVEVQYKQAQMKLVFQADLCTGFPSLRMLTI